MSITPKDLQDIFDSLGKAFNEPGAVQQAAQQIVGGKVIAGLPPETGNARQMTALLAGAAASGAVPTPAPQAQGSSQGAASTPAAQLPAGITGGFAGIYSAAGGGPTPQQGQGETAGPSGASTPPVAGGFAGIYSTAHGHQGGQSPTGTRSSPLAVELADTSAQNLARRIGHETRGAPGQSPWQKLTEAFSKIKKAVGFGGNEAPSEAAAPPLSPLLELASRNAAKLGQMGPRNWGPQAFSALKQSDPFGHLSAAAREGLVGRQRMKAVQGAETFTNVAGDKGYSSIIKAPPPAAVAAGEGEGFAAALAGAGGTALTFAAAIGLAVAATVGITEALKAFAESTIEGNRHLARWNGTLAVAMARLDIGNIQREAHMAGATSGSSSTLVNDYQNLANEFQPLAEDLASIKNLVALGAVEVARVLTAALKVLDALFGPLLRATEKYLGQSDNTALPLASLFDYLQQSNRHYGLAERRAEFSKHHARADKPEVGPAWVNQIPEARPVKPPHTGDWRERLEF